MLRPLQLSFLFLLHLYLLFLGPANALPTTITRTETSVVRRQDGNQFTEPFDITTSTTSDTPSGPVTETCKIMLTPGTDELGRQIVQEVKQCEVSLANDGGNTGSSNNGGNNSGTGTSLSTMATTSSTSTTATSTQSTSAASTAITSASSVSSSSSAASGESAVSVNGVSTVPLSSATATATASVSKASTTATSVSVSKAPTSTSASTSASAAAASVSASATSAADSTTSSQAAFAIPGKKLQVLPIGLGIFAGISVIALIVVGLVTYERTKYRKAFRQRKLAEAGANMGYGGMAERT